MSAESFPTIKPNLFFFDYPDGKKQVNIAVLFFMLKT